MIAVVGATATGKSGLAVGLARALGAEIVNGDAFQLYHELRIGVAKPGCAERAGIAHHLFELARVTEPMDAASYARHARRSIEEIWARGRVAIVAGGTGLYVSAVVAGIDPMPAIPDPIRQRIRQLVERRGATRAHRLLAHVDPALARRIDPRNPRRVARGLEVFFGAGVPLSALQTGRAEPLPAAWQAMLGVRRSRADLAARVARRVDRMWEAGLLGEARELVAAGLAAAVVARRPIGYREAFAVLRGELTEARAKELTVAATRRLARRQDTWWRRRAVAWLDVEGPGEPSIGRALEIVSSLC